MKSLLLLFSSNLDAIGSLVIRGLSVLAGFVVTWFIGNRYGPVANGEYAVITQTAMMLSVVAVGGLDLAIVREFSATIAKKCPLDQATLLRVLASASAAAALVMLVIFAMGPWALSHLLPGSRLADGPLLLGLILLARTLTRLLSGVLRSQGAFLLAQMVEVLTIPVLVCVVLASGVFGSVHAILWATVAAGLFAALIGIAVALRYTATSGPRVSVSLRRLGAIAWPLWGVAIALNFADWYGLAIASALLGTDQAGLYRVAMQIASVFGIVSMGLFGVFSAKISAAAAAQDKPLIARLGRTATLLSTMLVVPLAIILFALAEPILALIGPEFVVAAVVVRVAVIGQLAYTMTGPAGLTLALMGHQKLNLRITLVSSLALLLAVPYGAAAGGIVGIAVAASLILAGRNLTSLWLVWRLERINILAGRHSPAEEAAPL